MGKTRHNATNNGTLTIEQLNAIDLLITGKTDQEVADAIDRHRSTVMVSYRKSQVSLETVDRCDQLLIRHVGV